MQDKCVKGRRRQKHNLLREIIHETNEYKIIIRVEENRKPYQNGDYNISATVTNNTEKLVESSSGNSTYFPLPLLGNPVEKGMENHLTKALKKMKKREKKIKVAEEAELTENKIEQLVEKVLK